MQFGGWIRYGFSQPVKNFQAFFWIHGFMGLLSQKYADILDLTEKRNKVF
jgi:hypothetical protein